MCEDNIEIGVTEITNNILVSAQPTDQIIDINVTEQVEDVTLNITPSVVEVNIDVTQELITEVVTVDASTCVNIVDVTVTDATDNVTLNITPSLVEVNINRGQSTFRIIEVTNYSALPTEADPDTYYVTKDDNKLYRYDFTAEVYIEVSPAQNVWGQITGTLSNQTDLWNALNSKQNQLNGTGFVKANGTTISYDNSTYLTTGSASAIYVPYTGATGNVNLGEWGLSSGYLSLDNSPTNTPTTAGTLSWNNTDGTADLKLKGGNVTLQIGQENVIRVVNKTGATLNEADFRAVRVRLVSEGGAQGQRLAVLLAQGDSDHDSATTIGLVTETIANNQEGFITISGDVKEIDTTGAKSYGGAETWVDGDILYLSPDHAGYLTKVKPVAPQHMVVIGYVVYAHSQHGKIFVKVDNGYELDELHNVKINNVQYQDLLTWSTITNTWINNSFEGILGYEPIGLGFISSSATGLSYDYTTGVFSWTSGYSLPTNVKQGQWDTAYTNRIISLTTTGSSGAATLASNVLNIPNYTLSGLGGVPTTRTITINGTSYDLSADRSWTISTGSGLTGSGSAGQVTFWTGTSALSGSNNFFWNNSTGRLGIGTSSPSAQLHATNDIIVANDINIGHGNNNFTSNLGINTPLSAITTGLYNVSIGKNTGNAITTGYSNSIVGYNAGASLTTGYANTFIGNQAGLYTTTGNFNVAIGTLAGTYNTDFCIAIGYGAQPIANTTGAIFIGGWDLGSSITSYNNYTLIGYATTTDTFVKGSIHQEFVTSALVKADSTGKLVAAVVGTDYLSAITLTTTGSSGAATLTGSTLNIPNYTLTGLGGVPSTRTITINGTTYDLSANRSWTVGSALSASAPLSITSDVISISQANATTNGYLSSTDWSTFNAKQAALSGTGFVKISGTTISYDNTTYTPTSRLLTINGTAYDLSADRSWTITPGSGMRNISTFTATSGQTTFTISGGYTAGLVDVYINGARLSTSDFNATNGTTVVLGVGAITNDIVDIVSYTASATSGITGSGTSGYLSKWTGTSSINSSLVYDNGTNVGIGTASPSYKLDINGTARISGTTTIISDNSNAYSITLLGRTLDNASTINFFNNAGSTRYGFIYSDNTIIQYGTIGAIPMAFSTNGSERMRITSAGNVGIGTSSPNYPLHVYATSNARIGVEGTTNYSAVHYLNTGGSFYIGIDDSAGANFTGTGYGRFLYSAGAYPMVFLTNGTERLRLESNGNFTIPWLNQMTQIMNYDNTYRMGTLYQANARTLTFYSCGGDSTPAISFNTRLGTGASSTDYGTERMRITSSNVLIGISSTSPYLDGQISVAVPSGSAPAATFKNLNEGQFVASFWNATSTGDAIFQKFLTESGFSVRGSIDYNRGGGTVRYNTTSDANLKNIIGDSDKTKSIEILNSTRVREYSWKDDKTNKSQIGVIAQELYETFKGAVSVGDNIDKLNSSDYKTWGVDKTAFTFHLISGWQAHEKLIKELKAEIEILKAK